MKIAGGFIGGLIIGLIGVIVTMHLLTDDISAKQAAAYDQGLEKGLEMATADMQGNEVNIGDALNKGMAEDNQNLREQLSDVKMQLQVLNARDDVPQGVRDQIAEIINGMD